MIDLVDDAIRALVTKEADESIRHDLLTQLEAERLVLELGIRAPWLDPAERRELAASIVQPDP